MNKKKSIIAVLIGIVLVLTVGFFIFRSGDKDNEVKKVSNKKFKVLHIMSYHTPWDWTEDQLNGFKEPLKDMDIEYKVFEMDTKRNSGEEWMQSSAQNAKAIIEDWKPDLVYTSDDNVQKYVAKDYVNAETPFVFSAVNNSPSVYGFEGSENISGVLEQEHFIETVKLLKEISPDIKTIAVVVDSDPTWLGTIDKMRQKISELPVGVEIVRWDTIDSFEDYKKKIKEFNSSVDAIALLGIHTYKDSKGNNIPYQDVLKWTAENSDIPDFSFWQDRAQYGTLAVVAVSGYEQGLAAGKIAYGILAENRKASDYPIKTTIKGKPIINLARAKKLGININVELLSSVTIYNQFEWEK